MRKVDGNPIGIKGIHGYLGNVKRLYRYLVERELCEGNPFEGVKYPRLPDSVSRNILSEVQMERLLEYLRAFDAPGREALRLRRYKVHVVSEMMYASGLRIHEAAALRMDHIDVVRRKVLVCGGKGRRGREAFLTGYAAGVLGEYLKEGRSGVMKYGSANRGRAELVFGSKQGQLVAMVNGELKEACEKLDLPLITSHCFRHSLGTHLLKRGCDMQYIQVILGHESLNSTQVYTRVDGEDLRENLDRCHPRQWRRRE